MLPATLTIQQTYNHDLATGNLFTQELAIV